MTYKEMAALARSLLDPKDHSELFSSGYVAAVLEGANGKYYAGVNIDLVCGLGFCAERSAAASMITDGETVIKRVACVGRDGKPMPPCGCCREFIRQLSPENENTEFLLGEEPLKTAKLSELLPLPWQKGKNA